MLSKHSIVKDAEKAVHLAKQVKSWGRW